MLMLSGFDGRLHRTARAGCRAAMAALAVVLPWTAARGETPAQIAAALSAGRPDVAALIRAHPEWLKIWADPEWPDALLRSPVIPGTPWRTHDLRRPQPPVVQPAMTECAGPPPPPDATVLLGPAGPVGLVGERLSDWRRDGGVLTAAAKEYHRLSSVKTFGDVQVHLEFRAPTPVRDSWQFRGNSGVFLMGLYEVQLLDSFENPTYADGAMGALYGQVPPLVNASLPPGRWQCIDIAFTAPRFRGNRLLSPARATVIQNGIVVQAAAAFLGPTKFAKLQPYAAHAPSLPLQLQDHGDGTSMVGFRNVWARTLSLATSRP